MTLLVGITGGIGAGKSTLSKHLETKGYPVHESDKIVSEMYNKPKKPFLKLIKKLNLKEAIKKKKIDKKIIICVREKNKDYWKRTVAECFIKDESISSFMVINGYACDYVKYSKKKYAKEQEYAKSKKLGIWKMKFDPSWENKCRKK